jgi:hypothetical protein
VGRDTHLAIPLARGSPTCGRRSAQAGSVTSPPASGLPGQGASRPRGVWVHARAVTARSRARVVARRPGSARLSRAEPRRPARSAPSRRSGRGRVRPRAAPAPALHSIRWPVTPRDGVPARPQRLVALARAGDIAAPRPPAAPLTVPDPPRDPASAPAPAGHDESVRGGAPATAVASGAPSGDATGQRVVRRDVDCAFGRRRASSAAIRSRRFGERALSNRSRAHEPARALLVGPVPYANH